MPPVHSAGSPTASASTPHACMHAAQQEIVVRGIRYPYDAPGVETSAAGQEKRHVLVGVKTRFAELLGPEDDGVVEERSSVHGGAVRERLKKVGELLRVPFANGDELLHLRRVFRRRVAQRVVPVRDGRAIGAQQEGVAGITGGRPWSEAPVDACRLQRELQGGHGRGRCPWLDERRRSRRGRLRRS